MTIESRKLQLVEDILSIHSETLIDALEHIIAEGADNSVTKKLMTERALRSENDIKNGNVHSLSEAERKIDAKLNL